MTEVAYFLNSCKRHHGIHVSRYIRVYRKFIRLFVTHTWVQKNSYSIETSTPNAHQRVIVDRRRLTLQLVVRREFANLTEVSRISGKHGSSFF